VTAPDLIYPIFVEEGIDEKLPMASMPGSCASPEAALEREVEGNRPRRRAALMLFGVSAPHQDGRAAIRGSATGCSRAWCQVEARGAGHGDHPRYLFCETRSPAIAARIEHGNVANDVTSRISAAKAVVAIEAGATCSALAMMDGQGRGDPPRVDEAGHVEAPIMAYSSKFASSFYGPFARRSAATLVGDRKTYQIDPLNARERRESAIDEAEGR